MADTGFTIPELAEIVERVADDVKSHVPGSDARLRRRISRAVAVALSGVSYLLHKFAFNIARETLVDCASEVGVERWQGMFGLPDVQPVRSTGPVLFTGIDSTVIVGGTELVRGDEVEYTTDSDGTIGDSVSGEISIPVTATVAGIDGDALAGVSLTLVEPIAGVDSEATVDTGDIDGGVSEETVELRRIRVLERMADPPQGGSNPDYTAWVQEAVGGVRAVYVSANEPSVGHVTIRFILEPLDGDPANAIPSTAQAQDALDFIVGTATATPPYSDAAAPVPIAGDANFRAAVRTAPTHLDAQAITFQITNLDPDTATIRTAVEDALKALLLQRGEPGGTIKLSQFIGAIDAAPGEESHELTLINGISPADVVIGADSFPTLGTVSYV